MMFLKILHKYEDSVVACLTGHEHGGGYSQDKAGIHHLTLISPLESKIDAHAIVEVYDDKIKVQGYGAIESVTWEL